ncbi:hypothetical protein GWO13_10650 [Candidatus Bathyarchaeota archaeon]|nr:hypothetical protein [Candidatus Bathyarchaeota archaeon]
MTVFEVGQWMVKPEKQEEFTKLLKRILKYMKDNPKIFKEVKSLKIFSQTFGGIYGAYVELVEYDSLADYERSSKRMEKDEALAKMNKEFMLLIEPTTLSSNLWTFVMQL